MPTLKTRKRSICILAERLKRATPQERRRLSIHLGIEEECTPEKLEAAYIEAADDSIFRAVRKLIPNDAPTYFKVLLLIYKKLRPYAEDLDDSWRRVSRLELFSYRSPIEELDEFELEDKILEIYRAEYQDAKDKLTADPSLFKRIASYIPGAGTLGGGAATTLVVHTASRIPFAGLGPGAIAGPVGIALGVIMVGSQLSGPAYRKIVPATVELMQIGKRVEAMPKE